MTDKSHKHNFFNDRRDRKHKIVLASIAIGWGVMEALGRTPTQTEQFLGIIVYLVVAVKELKRGQRKIFDKLDHKVDVKDCETLMKGPKINFYNPVHKTGIDVEDVIRDSTNERRERQKNK